MRKTLLVLLTVLSLGSTLSGCFCWYRDDWDRRGYWDGRDYRDYRDYDGRRGGYRDYRDRR